MPFLILIRHGEAGNAYGEPDSARKLTPRGIEDVRVRGRWLAEHDEDKRAVRIHHSPYTRARHTAELLNEALNLPMNSMPDLTPSGSPDRVGG